MAPTISSAFSEFTNSIYHIGVELVNSVLAVFQAFLALGQSIIVAIVHFGQSLVTLVLNVFQGMIGFVAGEFGKMKLKVCQR